MKPEALVDKLKEALGDDLTSVILYGSAAAGDRVEKRSDYNVLVVAEALGVKELKSLSTASATWIKAGNPPPLLFTRERLKTSVDVFPIELLDIKQCHKILHGEDVLADMDLSRENLRLELEHELKGKLIQLREGYLATGGKPKRVIELVLDCQSTFLVLFRAALRLYEDEVPTLKIEAMQALSKHLDFDTGLFEQVDRYRRGEGKPDDADSLFGRYLSEIEKVVDLVDNYIHKGDQNE